MRTRTKLLPSAYNCGVPTLMSLPNILEACNFNDGDKPKRVAAARLTICGHETNDWLKSPSSTPSPSWAGRSRAVSTECSSVSVSRELIPLHKPASVSECDSRPVRQNILLARDHRPSHEITAMDGALTTHAFIALDIPANLAITPRRLSGRKTCSIITLVID